MVEEKEVEEEVFFCSFPDTWEAKLKESKFHFPPSFFVKFVLVFFLSNKNGVGILKFHVSFAEQANGIKLYPLENSVL